VRLLMLSAGLKLLAGPLFMLVIETFYGGIADALASLVHGVVEVTGVA
jgi:hypothetical protein